MKLHTGIHHPISLPLIHLLHIHCDAELRLLYGTEVLYSLRCIFQLGKAGSCEIITKRSWQFTRKEEYRAKIESRKPRFKFR